MSYNKYIFAALFCMLQMVTTAQAESDSNEYEDSCFGMFASSRSDSCSIAPSAQPAPPASISSGGVSVSSTPNECNDVSGQSLDAVRGAKNQASCLVSSNNMVSSKSDSSIGTTVLDSTIRPSGSVEINSNSDFFEYNGSGGG